MASSKQIQAIEAHLNTSDIGSKVVIFTTPAGACAGAHMLSTKDQGIAEAWAKTYVNAAFGDTWAVKTVTDQLRVA